MGKEDMILDVLYWDAVLYNKAHTSEDKIRMNFAKKQNPFLSSFLVLSLVFSGCVRYRPHPMERSSFMERKQTQTQGKVTVTVAVLSDKESKEIFGVALAKKGIQPVWLEIENKDTTPYIFIPRNMDPNYYSAEEAAYMAHYSQGKQFLEAGLIGIIFFPVLALIPVSFFMARSANKKMDTLFNKVSLPSHVIMPGAKENGFVFASVDEGTKHVHVNLIGDKEHTDFDFVVPIPGMKPDYTTKDFADRYPGETIVNYDEKGLIQALKGLPCCTVNKKGTKNGDPLNLVVIGELEDLVTIFTSARWDETRALTFISGLSMAKSFITGSSDRYSPVSPLYYDKHPQDIAFQKARDTINQRLHLRLWYTPMRYKTKPVWVGTISRDIGVKFTMTTWYMTTHKIDPNLDDARDYLLADLAEVQKVSQYGFIDNTALERTTQPRKNLTGDAYTTDNRRLVIELSTEDVPPSAFSWSGLIREEK